MTHQAQGWQHKAKLWLDDDQMHGADSPTDAGAAQAIAAKVAEALAAANIAAVAQAPRNFFVFLALTGDPGEGTFSDSLVNNTLAVVYRLSEEMRSALNEHDGRRRTFRDALILARNWIVSYGLLCRWASWAFIWRCQEAVLLENPPPCDWDESGDIRSHNVRVGVFGPFIAAHENASALLASAADPSERVALSMACAWLRKEDQSFNNPQPPCDAGKDVHEGLLILRRLVFGIYEMRPTAQFSRQERTAEDRSAAKKRKQTPAQKAGRRRGGEQRSVIEDQDARKILAEHKKRGKAVSLRNRANNLAGWCKSNGIARKDGQHLSLRNIQDLLNNTRRQSRLS